MNIRVLACGTCYFCGKSGRTLYEGLQDRLFGVPGDWSFRRCTNDRCGMLWLDPIPRLEDIGLAYRAYYTHQEIEANVSSSRQLTRRIINLVKAGYLSRKYGYLSRSFSAFQEWAGLFAYLNPLRRADLDAAVTYLEHREMGRLLDVGCGNGEALRTMSNLGWDVQGLDPDPEAVQRGQALGLRIRQGSLRECVYAPNQFDAVTLTHVIEHLHDPLSDLQEAHGLLKKGGLLVITTPNIGSLGHRLFRRNWVHLDPPRHLHIFASRPLAAMVDRAGFRVIKLFSTVRWAAYAFAHSMQIYWRGGSSLGVTPPQPLFALGWSLAFFEWSMLTFRPLLGEEIVLIAQKD